MQTSVQMLAALLREHENALLDEWLTELPQASRRGAGGGGESRRQAGDFLRLLVEAAGAEGSDARLSNAPALQDFLKNLSKMRVLDGYTSDETAVFVFSLKRPLFRVIQSAHKNDADKIAALTWAATELLDALGLITVRAYQEMREDVIHRQQQDLLELSTPVVKLWEGVLALPIIGTLDSARTQVVMESLLQRIADSESKIAIVDITGVPTVDTLVAQHLIKTVTALRLMGAECIVSGVRPQIAQTIVHLGVDLSSNTTKANLADALAIALDRVGFNVARRAG